MKHQITTFIIAEASKAKRTKEALPVPAEKSAPHYFEQSVPSQFMLGQKSVDVDGKSIELVAKVYHPDAVLVEATFDVPDIFAETILDFKDKVHEACYEFAKKYGGNLLISEEYTIYRVFGYTGDPDELVKHNRARIAALLKSEKYPLDEKEVEYTHSFQLKYGKDDLVIVDWDGAFVFDPDGDDAETVELLQLANYQLLRYRILDEDLDERLTKISNIAQFEPPKRYAWLWIPTKEISNEFREVIKVRSQSIAQFEALERDIKLIGDWYLARLYDLITKKFRLEEWRGVIREKLESLEDVYTIAAENLGMSRVQRLELIQILLFFVLQVGWFGLIVLEFFYFTK